MSGVLLARRHAVRAPAIEPVRYPIYAAGFTSSAFDETMIVTSDDGDDWTVRRTGVAWLPGSAIWSSVHEKFVGSSSALAGPTSAGYSLNGLDWTAVPAAPINMPVIYCPSLGKFWSMHLDLGSGTYNTYTSVDGETWASSTSFGAPYVQAAWAPGINKLYAIVNKTAMYTTTDLSTWTFVPLSFAHDPVDLIWSEDLASLVLRTTAGEIFTSTGDGTWTLASTPVLGIFGQNIGFGANSGVHLVAAPGIGLLGMGVDDADGGKVYSMYSADAVHWTTAYLGFTAADVVLAGSCYSADLGAAFAYTIDSAFAGNFYAWKITSTGATSSGPSPQFTSVYA